MLCPQGRIALTLDRNHSDTPGKSPDTFRDGDHRKGDQTVLIKTRTPTVLPQKVRQPIMYIESIIHGRLSPFYVGEGVPV